MYKYCTQTLYMYKVLYNELYSIFKNFIRKTWTDRAAERDDSCGAARSFHDGPLRGLRCLHCAPASLHLQAPRARHTSLRRFAYTHTVFNIQYCTVSTVLQLSFSVDKNRQLSIECSLIPFRGRESANSKSQQLSERNNWDLFSDSQLLRVYSKYVRVCRVQ